MQTAFTKYQVSLALLTALSSVSSMCLTTPSPATDFHFTVTTKPDWTDTGLDLVTGEIIQISAGESTCSATNAGTALPLPSAPAGSLLARLHAQGADPVSVGRSKEVKVEEPGHLFLGVNGTDCTVSFTVDVHVTAPPAATTDAKANTTYGQEMKSKLGTAAQIWLQGQFGNPTNPVSGDSSTAISEDSGQKVSTKNTAPDPNAYAVPSTPVDPKLQKLINSLPRRVNDEAKNLGDMVNFVIVGSQEQVQAALTAGKWFVADTNNNQAVLNAVLQTIAKKDYMAMPMSKLMLFDRYQDFGYEQAEPIAMVASRHHFRLWKAPFTWDNQTVWVGAGTHDIGFERDQRNGSVTHKIDPGVDGERQNIAESFHKSAKVKSMTYYLPPDPVQDARNATGGGYHSDGRMLVVFLQ
jgi:LssY C-terminus